KARRTSVPHGRTVEVVFAAAAGVCPAADVVLEAGGVTAGAEETGCAGQKQQPDPQYPPYSGSCERLLPRMVRSVAWFGTAGRSVSGFWASALKVEATLRAARVRIRRKMCMRFTVPFGLCWMAAPTRTRFDVRRGWSVSLCGTAWVSYRFALHLFYKTPLPQLALDGMASRMRTLDSFSTRSESFLDFSGFASTNPETRFRWACSCGVGW